MTVDGLPRARDLALRFGRARGGLYLDVAEGETKSWLFKRPQSNGIVERLNRTLLDEHFRVEGRRTVAPSADYPLCTS